MDQAHYVYVLWSDKAKRFYTGVTCDIPKRLEQHNTGLSVWTRRGIPWQVVWSRRFPNVTDARKFENLLKRQKGGQGFWRMTDLEPGRFRAGS